MQERSLAIFAPKEFLSMSDTLYMSRCLQLARSGSGSVSPNPMVGAVLVADGRIIGEGYHKKAGSPHAEVEAIRAVSDERLLTAATLYVNLEPCSHYGKTPPCTSLILEKKIPRVVVGTKDPFDRVNGSGIMQLRENGVEVTCGILEEECRNLNRRFITFHLKKRPYITLKWAQTADGFIGSKDKRINISNSLSGIYSHKLRHSEDAILVGAGTVRTDDPRLSTRNWTGRSPVRIIVDPNGSLNGQPGYHVFDGSVRTIVVTQQEEADYPNSEVIRVSENLALISSLAPILHQEGLSSVLVEGGGRMLNLFLQAGIWDECHVFTAPLRLEQGVAAPGVPTGRTRHIELQNNSLTIVHNVRELATFT